MANGLHYVVTQVSSYLVLAAQGNSDIEAIQSHLDKMIVECAEIKARVAKMEADKRS